MKSSEFRSHHAPTANDLEPYRTKLSRALGQAQLGGVSRALLVAERLTADDCTAAIKLGWQMKDSKAKMWPGMSLNGRAASVGNIGAIRALDRVWRCARELLGQPDRTVSGRLFLAEAEIEHGAVRVVRTRGVLPVHYQVPTLLMDATLPAKRVLQVWFPDVEIVENIEAPMPHARVRQVVGAPVAHKKLIGGAGSHLRAVRRYVLREWNKARRGETLVVAQQDVQAALGTLPANIHVEHFNNVSGLDRYKDVRLEITIGRTQPGPLVFEDDAGALSGIEPIKAATRPNGSTWFD
jgi:hypothetical protein